MTTLARAVTATSGIGIDTLLSTFILTWLGKWWHKRSHDWVSFLMHAMELLADHVNNGGVSEKHGEHCALEHWPKSRLNR